MRSLPTPEVRGSIPIPSLHHVSLNSLSTNCKLAKPKMKEKRGWERPIIKKVCSEFVIFFVSEILLKEVSQPRLIWGREREKKRIDHRQTLFNFQTSHQHKFLGATPTFLDYRLTQRIIFPISVSNFSLRVYIELTKVELYVWSTLSIIPQSLNTFQWLWHSGRAIEILAII